MRAIFIGVAIVIAALVTGIAAVAEFDAQKQSLPSRRERPTAAVAIDSSTDAEWASDLTEIEVWAKDTERHEREWSEGEWNAGIERQRLADEAEAARAAQVRPAAPRTAAVPSGDCGPVAAVVGWGTVQHESGGNPYATNGIYLGCAQIGMPWWQGACAGLDWRNVYDQAACARIVMQLQGPSAWAGTYSP